jgi:regulator of protease activity HflC (stomatin/prohibitin superfamily)
MNSNLMRSAYIGGVVIIAAIWLISGIVIVPAGNVGVITQFSKVTGREMSPGFNFKAPWPIQRADIFTTQIQKEQTDAEAASTDLQNVTATVAVNYHLDRGKVSDIYQNIGDDYKGRIIDPAIQETVKATISKYNASELISNRQSVKDAVDSTLAARVQQYGIIIDAVSIVNFNFSAEFNKAIEQKQVAQQQAEQAQYNLQKAQLDAQAQESVKASLTDQILEQQAIAKWDGHMPQYVGSGSVFNIPLTK